MDVKDPVLAARLAGCHPPQRAAAAASVVVRPPRPRGRPPRGLGGCDDLAAAAAAAPAEDLRGEVEDGLDEFEVVVLGLQVDPLGEGNQT